VRYENGYASYLEVLDADSRLYSAQLTQVQTQGNLFQALVNVYNAMGGGWVLEADKMTISPQEAAGKLSGSSGSSSNEVKSTSIQPLAEEKNSAHVKANDRSMLSIRK
jgi:multidrug efflux system outer membrane protein